MLLQLVNLCDVKEGPCIHGRREMETVSGVNWGVRRVGHGMIIALSVFSGEEISFCTSHHVVKSGDVSRA